MLSRDSEKEDTQFVPIVLHCHWGGANLMLASGFLHHDEFGQLEELETLILDNP